MKTFIEINTINQFGEKGVALIRSNDIIGIKELHVESTKLYNENGDLVSETPATDKDFQVLVVSERGNSEKFHVGEDEYQRLVKELTNE